MQSRPTQEQSRPRRRSAWITAALAVGALALAGPTFGQASTANAAGAVDVDRYVTGVSVAEVTSYWTPERMEAAKNADALMPSLEQESTALAARDSVVRGTPTTIAAQPAKSEKGIQSPDAVTPVSHIGKVFFTMGGSDYVCSANSVASQNRRTVATAGHCLNQGPGAYATRFTFVPAYENGRAPYGQWPATELIAPRAWTENGDINYDTGFAVVASPSGTTATLSDRVGASGVAFNQSRGLNYQAYGYPAASPFNGQTLETCSGTARQDTYNGTSSQGIPCNMTGGSSGGPWFIGTGSRGTQNSVNSFGYNAVRNVMWGPYWGSVIQSTYSEAQS